MENTTLTKKQGGLSSFALHIVAMVLMLSDHLWATVVPGNAWMTLIGRIAYPLFAFFIAEGYARTRDVNKYMKRLLVSALLSEIPFNLMYGSSWLYPFHQNVLWTFLWALLCLKSLDKIREKHKIGTALPLGAVVVGLFMLAAQLTMTDYYGYGLLTVVVFYLFPGQGWLPRLGQLASLIWINWFAIKGLQFPVELFGSEINIPQQGFAVLALLPIWLYNGRQGPHSKGIRYIFYGFYPVHMLILWLISSLV